MARDLAEPPARIGPNALTQTAAALTALKGAAAAETIFARAGLLHRWREPPGEMVPEAEPARLFAAVAEALGEAEARAVLAESGRLTGDYILANRIPGPARGLLRLLPARIAAWMLLSAILRHAWTFAGSGRCRAEGLSLVIEGNPLRSPGGVWHEAVLSRLFARLASRRAKVSRISAAPERFAISLG